jgi:hypothetical protein
MAALPVRRNGIQAGEVVDDVVGGARTVDGDQHVGPPAGEDLPERRGQT